MKSSDRLFSITYENVIFCVTFCILHEDSVIKDRNSITNTGRTNELRNDNAIL